MAMCVAVRAVTSRDALTAEAMELSLAGSQAHFWPDHRGDPDSLRVVYDLTPKPPGTIEFE